MYSVEIKNEAISRYEAGNESTSAILSSTGVAKSTFYGWLKGYKIKQDTANALEFTPKNYRILTNKVTRLQGIIEILHKVNCSANSPLPEKLYELERLNGEYSVHMLCEALNVSRGTFYNHILRNKRDNTWYAKRREELKQQISDVYDESMQRFGSGKITAVLHSRGISVSPEMVRSIMRDLGLISIREGAKDYYDRMRENHYHTPNAQRKNTAPPYIFMCLLATLQQGLSWEEEHARAQHNETVSFSRRHGNANRVSRALIGSI